LTHERRSSRMNDKKQLATAAKAPQYLAAVADLEKLCGIGPKAMNDVVGGFTGRIAPAKKKSFKFPKVHDDFLKRGCYVFMPDEDELTRVAVLPTTDQFAVVQAVGTEAPNYDITTKQIVAWLRKLAKDQPFVLTTVNAEYLGGRFTTKVKDVDELVWRMLDFCPDLENPVELEKDLRKGTLWLWWD